MNTLDIIILVVLGIGIAHGIRTGLIKQVASILGMVVAFFLGVAFMVPVGQKLVESLGFSETLGPLLGFTLVFVIVHLVVIGAMKALEKAVGALKLSAINRGAGGAVGAFKAAFVLSVLLMLVGNMGYPNDGMRDTSLFYTPVATVMPASWSFVQDRMPQIRQLTDRVGLTVGDVRDQAVEAIEAVEAAEELSN